MNLDNLKPRIDTFVDFARKFPAAYRPAIITYLLQLDAAERGAGVSVGAASWATTPKSASPGKPARPTGNIHPAIVELAGEISVPADVLDRRLVTVTDDRPEIRWTSDEVSQARRQIEYALVYTFVLEKMGQLGATITELRNLCIQKRSYNMPNFVSTFRRQRNLLQIADIPGAKDQEVVLTGPGRQRARELLSRAVDALGTPAVSEPVVTKRTVVQVDEPEESEDQPELNLDLPSSGEEQEVTFTQGDRNGTA